MNHSDTHARRLIAMAALGLLTGGFAVASPPEDSKDSPTTAVAFADLNVSSQPGALALYARIRTAADGVCRSLNNRDLKSQSAFHACVNSAIAGAVAKVDVPALYAVYNSKTGTLHASTIRLADQSR